MSNNKLKKKQKQAAAKEQKKAESKKIITGLVVGLIVLIVALMVLFNQSSDGSDTYTGETSGDGSTTGTETELPMTGSKVYEGSELLSGKYTAEIDVKDYGVITVELDADKAPQTVSNFVALAESGFYDGLTFHRIIDGFMIQGGDPNGNGTGGSDDTITGEFAANGIENDISHERGVISMARANAYNSGSSQFFIVHQDNRESLDGLYAGFGHVTSGMEIVDAICADTPV